MKLIDKDALVAEIEKLLDDEYQCSSYDEATGFQHALGLIKSFIDTLEVKRIGNAWNDSRTTVPEDSKNQIVCIKEDGLAVSTVGKLVNGTIKWAYLNDLFNI